MRLAASLERMHTAMADPTLPLRAWRPEHPFFVGIDSDGCVFETMELKIKECFIPNIIRYWGLQPVSKFARETAEFVNLYSRWRGSNRWPALVKVLDLLRVRPEVIARRAPVPEVPAVREFLAQTEFPHSNDGLRDYMARRGGDAELETALAWSEAVNASVAAMVTGVPPFPRVRDSLAALHPRADMIVVSTTPCAALEREWAAHDLAGYVRVFGGQELGTKIEILGLTAAQYPAGHSLMIGDSGGDLAAAQAVGALFYPILPGREAAAWEQFHAEALARFFAGTYAGAYQDARIAEFARYLPEVPPWQQ